jgi:hypothetical protein
MKAYPFIHKHPTTGNTKLEEGLDLRDYFAARAMQGLLAADTGFTMYSANIAEIAYTQADAMLKAREVKHDQP